MREKNKQRIFTSDIYPSQRLWLNGGLIDLRKEQHDCIFHFLLALAVILARHGLSAMTDKNSYSLYSPVDYYRNSARFLFLHAESGLWLVKNISGFLLRY